MKQGERFAGWPDEMYARVVEYGPPVELALTKEQVSSLVSLNTYWKRSLRLPRPPLVIEPTLGGVALRARDVAGFVRAGQVSLDIVPKFLDPDEVGARWRVGLWRLLAFASGIDAIPVPTEGIESDHDGIADLLADMFLRGIRSASQLGLPLGYQTQHELSPFLSGRLDPQRLGRLAIPDGLVPVRGMRLSRDTDNGRLLRWASLKLSALVDSRHRRSELISWAETLPEVRPVPPERFHSHLVARQFPHLSQAFQVAEMLLEDRWGDYGPGSLEVPGFLWKSEALFEKSVLRLVRRSAQQLRLGAEKRTYVLATDPAPDSGGDMSTSPDVTVFEDDLPVCVLDAKYKVLSGNPSSSDVYQLLSSGRVTSAQRVALVYPSAESGLSVRRLIPRGPGLPRSIDLLSLGLISFGSSQDLRYMSRQLTHWLKSATANE